MSADIDHWKVSFIIAFMPILFACIIVYAYGGLSQSITESIPVINIPVASVFVKSIPIRYVTVNLPLSIHIT